MPKKRDKSSEEWYRGKLREQDKELRSLRKEVKHLKKHEHFYEGQDDKEVSISSEDTIPKTLAKRVCDSCGKGEIRTFELIGRVFEECSVCDFRKKIN